MQAEIISRAYMPAWVPPTLLPICLLLAGALIWGLSVLLSPRQGDTPPIVPGIILTSTLAITDPPTATVAPVSTVTVPAVTDVPTITLTSPPAQPPIVRVAADKAGGVAPLAIRFTGNGSEGTFTTSLWNFGDGGTSNEINAAYTFVRSGVYGSKLTVTGPGGSDEKVLPIVVAPHSSEPLSLSVWLTANDFDDFPIRKEDWSDTFPPGSQIFFRDMTDLLIPYIKNEAPLAAGDPDVLYLSSETMLRLDELFFQGYSIYTEESGDQPPVQAIFVFPQLTPLLDEYLVSYPIDRSKFAARDGVVYGIPYSNGYLVPVPHVRNGFKPTQALFFAIRLHLQQAE